MTTEGETIMNLLENHDLWGRLSDRLGETLRWDKDGSLALLNETRDTEMQCSYGRRLALAGGRLRIDMRFIGTPSAKMFGGLRFDGITAQDGKTLAVFILPEKNQVQAGQTTKDIGFSVEDPYHYDLDLAFEASTLHVYWGGNLIAETSIAYEAETAAIVPSVGPGAVSFSQLFMTASQRAAEIAAKDRKFTKVSLQVNESTMVSMPSQWAEYFGTHYASSPQLAGVAWRTVRNYGGTHTGISQDESQRGIGEPVRIGPFTGKDVKVGLRDFHSQGMNRSNAKTAEEIIPELIANHITDINLVSNMVPPSDAQPFDKDLAYWTIRLLHEKYPEAKDNLVWQIGNEVVSSHFDPKGFAKSADGKAITTPITADGKVFGYDLEWKRDYYVNRYLAPAIEAIEKASRDVYKDPTTIKIVLGSMNPYNDYNKRFLREVMDSTFDGKEAPSLEGEPVWKHFTHITVHYMCGNDTTIKTMQQYLDEYVKTGKVQGIWVTEDHGRGPGPVTIIDRGLRFLAWAARNGLTAQQTRLVWYGDYVKKAGGTGGEVTSRIGKLLRDKPLFLLEKRAAPITYYVLADAEGSGIDRMLIAVVPAPSGSIDLGVLTLELPTGVAQRGWKAEATQYSSFVPPHPVAATLTKDGNNLNISISHSITEPFLLWLIASTKESQ